VEDQADEIGGRYGEVVANEFLGIATGTATPLLHYMDAWLKEGGKRGPVSLRTQWQYKPPWIGQSLAKLNAQRLQEWKGKAKESVHDGGSPHAAEWEHRSRVA
jgi:hypothetical protein